MCNLQICRQIAKAKKNHTNYFCSQKQKKLLPQQKKFQTFLGNVKMLLAQNHGKKMGSRMCIKRLDFKKFWEQNGKYVIIDLYWHW